MQQPDQRDHGGGVDAAAARFGGQRADWIDLSTGINPQPYPTPDLPADAWSALPDAGAQTALEEAARAFWQVPAGAALLAVPGASAAIARIPALAPRGTVRIPGPTYNEHAASFAESGWQVVKGGKTEATVHVHPNNPDGRLWPAAETIAPLSIIDESFCDITPDATLMAEATRPGTLILKSFGKFWGLAGLRLGFVIGDPALVAELRRMLGPWPVSGPALHIGAAALRDRDWAHVTRIRLAADADRIDKLMTGASAQIVGGTPLFRLYEVNDAQAWQTRLAQNHIWTRIFPYNPRWLRLGLPPTRGWARLEQALA
ncbi:threonine-phosphate decarboxylase [Sulfitobacter sp. S0837]|uniref:threonine-phosphate decarboxylase CobD n=1 Tax=Sulfitobacter maritimus TaxID=2741719 RepID=UPI001581DC9E|nr:threonine-phosphate decarboxylase CobD [Sulfitobacter maritimus]NUH66689.1 threonine-phosphate decarboxylase [Sulfitobacter maritimus]